MQSFIVLPSLVFELAGGQNDSPPQSLTLQKTPWSLIILWKGNSWFLRGSKSSKMVQPPFEIFWVPASLRVSYLVQNIYMSMKRYGKENWDGFKSYRRLCLKHSITSHSERFSGFLLRTINLQYLKLNVY